MMGERRVAENNSEARAFDRAAKYGYRTGGLSANGQTVQCASLLQRLKQRWILRQNQIKPEIQ